MNYLKEILRRLKNPSVVLGIVSQILTVLMLLRINVDKTVVVGIVSAVCSILVILGIMTDPTATRKSYIGDWYLCENCGKKTLHTMVNGKMVCKTCGTENRQIK